MVDGPGRAPSTLRPSSARLRARPRRPSTSRNARVVDNDVLAVAPGSAATFPASEVARPSADARPSRSETRHGLARRRPGRVPVRQYLLATHDCRLQRHNSGPQSARVETPSACPMCGTPVQPDADFCSECDSLVTPAAPPRPTLAVASGAGTLPTAAASAPSGASAARVRPSPGAASSPVPRSSSSPKNAAGPAPVGPIIARDNASPSVACWDCGTPNPPSRAFCRACGVWIAIGSASASTASWTSNAPARPASSTSTMPASRASGSPVLGPRPMDLGRPSVVRKRRLAVAVSALVLAGVVGVAALQPWASQRSTLLAGAPSGGGAEAAALVAAEPDTEARRTPLPRRTPRTRPTQRARGPRPPGSRRPAGRPGPRGPPSRPTRLTSPGPRDRPARTPGRRSRPQGAPPASRSRVPRRPPCH